MKILVVGGGGREHAIVCAIAKSALADEIFCAPGNPGTAKVGKNVPIKATDIEGLKQFALANKIDLTIIGPEDPLALGIVDEFQAAGLKAFGPTSEGAQSESSKVFAKEIMNKKGILNAKYDIYHDAEECKKCLLDKPFKPDFPIVIKANGLAAGKGVGVCHDMQEALDFLDKLITGKIKLGTDKKILIERFIHGEEASIIYIVDSRNGSAVQLSSAQDHKARDEGDKGPNTGGMGAYSPAPIVTPEIEKIAREKIVLPYLEALEEKGIHYVGFFYLGVKIHEGKVHVLEINVRLGDPETQPVLYRLESDFLAHLLAAMNGTLDQEKLIWSSDSAITVVLAAIGYPEPPKTGCEILGISEAEALGAVIHHAGTIIGDDGKLLTNGGRVLNVTCKGRTLAEAQKKVYLAIEKINCGLARLFCRHDIGIKAIRGNFKP